MDIAGDGGCVMVTWDSWVHIGSGSAGGMSSKDSGFNGNSCLPMSSGGMVLGNIGGGLVAGAIVMEGGSNGEEKNGVGL